MIHFPFINRQAVILTPKQPYIDWVRKVSIGDKYSFEGHVNVIYLISETSDKDDAIAILRRKSKTIFETELSSWVVFENAWPIQRGWKTFNKWFSFNIIEIVYDIAIEGLEREEL